MAEKGGCGFPHPVQRKPLGQVAKRNCSNSLEDNGDRCSVTNAKKRFNKLQKGQKRAIDERVHSAKTQNSAPVSRNAPVSRSGEVVKHDLITFTTSF